MHKKEETCGCKFQLGFQIPQQSKYTVLNSAQHMLGDGSGKHMDEESSGKAVIVKGGFMIEKGKSDSSGN